MGNTSIKSKADYLISELKKSKKIQDLYETYIDKKVCPSFDDWVELTYKRVTEGKVIDANEVLKQLGEKILGKVN